MPNTVRVSKTVKVFEYLCYVLLLCVIVPIQEDHHELEYEKYLQQFNKTYESTNIYQNRFEAFKVSPKVPVLSVIQNSR